MVTMLSTSLPLDQMLKCGHISQPLEQNLLKTVISIFMSGSESGNKQYVPTLLTFMHPASLFFYPWRTKIHTKSNVFTANSRFIVFWVMKRLFR